MSSARPVAFLLLLALMLPLAQAVQLPGLPHATVDDRSDAPTSQAAQASTDDEREYLGFTALGDVDGDGRDDLLQVQDNYDDDGSTVHLVARSGADLGQVLWSVDSEDAIDIVPDVDGDGIVDYATITGDLTSDSLIAPTPLGAAYRFQYSGNADFAFKSGRDGHALATVPGAYGYDMTYAYTFAPLVGGVIAYNTVYRDTGVAMPNPGSLTGIDATFASLDAYVFGPVGLVRPAVEDQDVTLASFDAAGAPQYTKAFVDSVRTVGGADVGDLDGDGHDDGVVTDLLDLGKALSSTPVAGVHLYKPTYTAFGKSGDLWSIERDVVLDVEGPLVVGDLDGDGGDDVEILEVTLDGTTTLLLSGRTGAILGQAATGQDITVLLPFGDVDGDGSDEGTYVHAGGALEVGVAGKDLKPRWSTPLGEDDDFVGLGLARDGGSIHFTGGPGPDLLALRDLDGQITVHYEYDYDGGDVDYTLGMEIEAYSLTLEAFDGATGQVTWTTPLSDVFNLDVCGDVDGRGGEDLCIVTITGDKALLKDGKLSNATLALRILAGEDGRVLLEQELRGPGSAPIGDVGILSTTLVAVGDLTGDGPGEVGVAVATRAAKGTGNMPPMPVDWYLLGLDGELGPVAARSDGVGADGAVRTLATAATTDAKLPPPLPEPVATASLDGQKPNKSPGIGLVAAVAALAAVALLARRRKA